MLLHVDEYVRPDRDRTDGDRTDGDRADGADTDGDRVAVLLHGMVGSAQSWWRVAPLLANRGYRVLALDLPGHGVSPRDPELTIERAADAVNQTVESLVRGPLDGTVRPNAPRVALAIGHSFGGLVLAAAADRMQPGLAVYVDSPFSSRGGHDRAEVTAQYESDRRERTFARLRETRPHYSERDCEVEALAAERFDAATGAAIAAAGGGSWPPLAGSIVVSPDPSGYVTSADAKALEARGVVVRSIPGASHSVWYSHFDEFVAALPEVFG